MVRQNLVANPSFETGLTGWTTNGNGIRREQTPFTAQAGTWYAYDNSPSTLTLFVYQGTAGGQPVVAGQSYAASIYLNRDGTNSVTFGIDWFNAGGTKLSASQAANLTPATGVWARASFVATAPATAVRGSLWVNFNSQAAGQFFRVDAAMLEPAATVGTYADGATAGWMWTGTAHASSSQESTVTQTGSDTGTGTQTGTATTTTTTTTNTGTGTETGYVAVPRSGSDTGTGADTLGPLDTTTTGADTATGDPGTASLSGATTGADTATGAELAHIDADTLAAPDAGTGAESGHIVLPGGDTAAGTEHLGDLHAWVTGGDTATGADGGYVESLLGDLVVSIFAIVDSAPVPLPDYQQLTLAPTRNGPGSITLTYPVAGLNFDVLREHTVGDDRDLEVEIWTIGSPLGALRGYLQEGAGDDVKEGAGGSWQFTGGFLELRMGEAIVYPQPLVGETTLGEDVEVTEASVTTAQWSRFYALGYRTTDDENTKLTAPQKVVDAVKADAVDIPVLADPKREAKFEAATPGSIVLFLLGQSWARGALDDLTTTFTAAADTNGTEWPSLLSTKFSPGTGYDAVLGLLVELGLVEWSVSWTGDHPCLNMWVAGDRGVDLTVGARPVVLRAGRNLAEAPRKWSVRSSPTAMLGIGAEGFYADTSDLDVETRRGRRIETSATSGNLADGDAVLAYAQRRLETSSDGTLEVTVGLALLAGEPRPAVAFDVGDWALAAFGTGLDAYRIVEWSLTIDAARQMSATVTLNDSFADELVRQRQQLDAITSGAAVVGTSEPPEDRGVPAAPTGLTVGSEAFLQGAEVRSSVLVGWSAVEVNTDGSAATDIDSYRVEWTLVSTPDLWGFGADVTGTQATFTTGPDLLIRVRVQARDRSGNRSAWSVPVDHVTEDDLSPPPVPSTPACTNFLGTLRIAWDGLTDTGADIQAAAADFDHVEVHVDPGSGFTPATGTLVGQLNGHGEWVVTDLPYDVTQFVRLVAVDNRGNRSAPSAQGSATPGKVVSDDVFDGAIGTAKLANLAVKTAQIDNLAVNDAKIGNVSMGKVTAGSIAASMIFTSGGQIGTRPPGATGSGWTGDSAGIRFYDSSGNETIRLVGGTGSALLTGTLQTGRTGRRIVVSGASQAVTFYPEGSETRTARLGSFIPDNYPSDIALRMTASSSPSATRSAEITAMPDFGNIGVYPQPYVSSTAFYSQLTVLDDTLRYQTRAAPEGPNPSASLTLGESGSGYQPVMYASYGGTAHIGAAIHNAGVMSFRSGVTSVASAGLVSLRGDSETQVVNDLADSWRRIIASAFTLGTSSATVKDDFAPLPGSPLAVLRGAPITRWRRMDAAPDTPPQIGPVTEDLPEWMVHLQAQPRDPSVEGADVTYREALSLDSLVGLVWDAVRELDAELDEIRTERGSPAPARRRTADTLADARSGRYRSFKRTKGNP